MIDETRPLVLGSGSPRRRELIASLQLPFLVRPADVDESRRPGEAAALYLERVVSAKLEAVRKRAANLAHAALLVADTIVVVDGDVLGKPTDVADAVRLFTRLSGRIHSVFTRYALQSAGSAAPSVERTVETRVTVRRATPQEIRSYAATGEGLDKAGAYAAQGLGAFFIERIEGSYSNVIGLPACEVFADLQRLGLVGANVLARVEESG